MVRLGEPGSDDEGSEGDEGPDEVREDIFFHGRLLGLLVGLEVAFTGPLMSGFRILIRPGGKGASGDLVA